MVFATQKDGLCRLALQFVAGSSGSEDLHGGDLKYCYSQGAEVAGAATGADATTYLFWGRRF